MSPVPQRVGTGYRVPGNWAAGRHTGVDYLSPSGTTVVAPVDSRIIHAGWGGWGRAYGIHVVGECVIGGIEYRWIVAHLSREDVTVGQMVAEGHRVGLSGNTGNSTGPHVHFEVRRSPFSYGHDVDPAILINAHSDTHTGGQTLWDESFWNVAYPPWYKPWGPRSAGIIEEIRGLPERGTEASVHHFVEVYSAEQVATIAKALGPDFRRANRRDGKGGAFGHEFWYAADVHMLQREPKSYPSGIQNRGAFVNHTIHRRTGQHAAHMTLHGPIRYNNLKEGYGRWAARLAGQIDGPLVIAGDFNRTSKSPRTELEALGYRAIRRQTKNVENYNADEFPSRGWNLSDIYTHPSEAKITRGEIDVTSSRYSDHRRIEARVVIG